MIEKNPIGADEVSVGNIAEELWIYSKAMELLKEPEDACYLADEIQMIETNIKEIFCSLKDKLSSNDIDWLTEICNGVFSGEKFDDIIFNKVIEHFA